MITLSHRRTVAGDFGPEPQARELTATELDHVAGGVLPVVVIVVLAAIAVKEAGDGSGSENNEPNDDGGEG